MTWPVQVGLESSNTGCRISGGSGRERGLRCVWAARLLWGGVGTLTKVVLSGEMLCIPCLRGTGLLLHPGSLCTCETTLDHPRSPQLSPWCVLLSHLTQAGPARLQSWNLGTAEMLYGPDAGRRVGTGEEWEDPTLRVCVLAAGWILPDLLAG